MNKRTKQVKIRTIILGILHFLFWLGPFFYFIPAAFVTAEVGSKVLLSLTAIVTLIIGGISLLSDVKHKAGLQRSMLWSLVIGVMYCLESVAPFIWTLAITSIVDEVALRPLYEKHQVALLANKEMDKRGL